MKAKLTFNLPDEESEFHDAINGNAYKAVIWELDQFLRSQLKHQEMPDEVSVKVLEIRKELHSILQDHLITMDQIWQ
jgi:hypothetical protein